MEGVKAVEQRARALAALQAETFDLLVIGAGIIGARIALEAATNGRRVALVDAADFGGATSSASSKLIHGGLRYLQMGDLRLVREAHVERRALLERIAPHLVRSQRFLVPVYRGAPQPRAVIAAGLFLYSATSGFRHSQARMVSAAGGRKLVPSLRLEELRGCGVYLDAQTHDSRLTLATVTGASRAGAVVQNHLAVVGLEFAPAGIAAQLQGGGEVRARQVINAAGPWVDRVRRMEDPTAQPIARLSKGVHLLLPEEAGWQAALTVPLSGGRVAFAVPWEGMLMLGTTDTEFDGEPEDAGVTAADEAEVLAEAARALPPELLRPERIAHRFAGLRVLPLGEGRTSDATREHLVREGPWGMLSVAGGKLTTHRRIAHDVLRRLPGYHGVKFGEEPLPGAGPVLPRPAAIPPNTWEHLVHLYGSEVDQVLAWAATDPGALEPIHPDGPDIWAQVHHAVAREWAVIPEDVLRRRTTVEIRGLATEPIRRGIAGLLED
ncbi:MAG: glycerol-3-phosphate dehydrogenase/oxidase [Candidatus Dormibacteraceae bacterium]